MNERLRRWLTRDAVRDYRTVYVWDEQERRLRSVVSIQEFDPGSGCSHQYRWSRDGKALLITGRGALPLRGAARALALVYVAAEKRLYEVPPCA